MFAKKNYIINEFIIPLATDGKTMFQLSISPRSGGFPLLFFADWTFIHLIYNGDICIGPMMASVPIQIGWPIVAFVVFARKIERLFVCFSSLNRVVWRPPDDGTAKRTNSHCNCHIWMVLHQWIDRGFGWNENNGNCREWSLGPSGWSRMDNVIFRLLVF